MHGKRFKSPFGTGGDFDCDGRFHGLFMVKFGRRTGCGNFQPDRNFDLFGHGDELGRLHIDGFFNGHRRFWIRGFDFRNRCFLHN